MDNDPRPPNRRGRKPGVPNHSTLKARSRFLEAFRRNEINLDKWLQEVAEGWEETRYTRDGTAYQAHTGRDPGRAAELMLRMAEYHFPKLGRLEHVGQGGAPISIVMREDRDA